MIFPWQPVQAPQIKGLVEPDVASEPSCLINTNSAFPSAISLFIHMRCALWKELFQLSKVHVAVLSQSLTATPSILRDFCVISSLDFKGILHKLRWLI